MRLQIGSGIGEEIRGNGEGEPRSPAADQSVVEKISDELLGEPVPAERLDLGSGQWPRHLAWIFVLVARER